MKWTAEQPPEPFFIISVSLVDNNPNLIGDLYFLEVAANVTGEGCTSHARCSKKLHLQLQVYHLVCKTLGTTAQGYVQARNITHRPISIHGENNSIMRRSFSIISWDNKDIIQKMKVC